MVWVSNKVRIECQHTYRLTHHRCTMTLAYYGQEGNWGRRPSRGWVMDIHAFYFDYNIFNHSRGNLYYPFITKSVRKFGTIPGNGFVSYLNCIQSPVVFNAKMKVCWSRIHYSWTCKRHLGIEFRGSGS